jgi:serine/threonine-protein phosphatase PP1 catalytic subunit
MSVSAELLCSFELLKPLDSSALKSHIKKSRNKRQSMLNSPVREYTGPAERTTVTGPCIIRSIQELTLLCSLQISIRRVTNMFSS